MSAPLARSEGLVVEELGDEVLIYDLDSDEAHSLDAPAAAIWRACDGSDTVAGIAARAGQPEAAVRSTVERLAELDLLAAGSFASVTHSRRDVLRRGLVVGAGVAAVPVIRSIVAPTAAHAQSNCNPDGELCGGDGFPCCSGCCVDGDCAPSIECD